MRSREREREREKMKDREKKREWQEKMLPLFVVMCFDERGNIVNYRVTSFELMNASLINFLSHSLSLILYPVKRGKVTTRKNESPHGNNNIRERERERKKNSLSILTSTLP